MKIAGKKLVDRNKATVHFYLSDNEEPMEVTLTALPLNWQRLMLSRGVLDFPKAPMVPQKFGGKHIRNPETKKVELFEDTQDPEYNRRIQIFTRRFQALKFKALVEHDPKVEFEAEEPKSDKKEEWQAYADKLWNELEEFGLSESDLAKVLESGDELGSRVDVEGGIDRFLSQQEANHQENGQS